MAGCWILMLSIPNIVLMAVATIGMVVGIQNRLSLPSMHGVIDKLFVAEQDFDAVSSAMDAQLRAATDGEEVASRLEMFNKSADKAIVSIEEMIATMRAISKDKVACTESGDLQVSDVQKQKGAIDSYRHGVHEFSTISDESVDKVQVFLGNSRVLTAAQEADKMRGRFVALGNLASRDEGIWRELASRRREYGWHGDASSRGLGTVLCVDGCH